jgi:hypothetical protein
MSQDLTCKEDDIFQMEELRRLRRLLYREGGASFPVLDFLAIENARLIEVNDQLHWQNVLNQEASHRIEEMERMTRSQNRILRRQLRQQIRRFNKYQRYQRWLERRVTFRREHTSLGSTYIRNAYNDFTAQNLEDSETEVAETEVEDNLE